MTAFSNSLEPNEHLASSGQPKLMSQRVREKLISTLQLPGSGQDWEHFLLGGALKHPSFHFLSAQDISFWLRQELKEEQCIAVTFLVLSLSAPALSFISLSALFHQLSLSSFSALSQLVRSSRSKSLKLSLKLILHRTERA